MEVLNGKVVVLEDNSPVALLLPTDVNSFLKTTDDYYNRFYMATFARLIRYAAAFFALTLPGLYLAVTNFHTQILPTPLLLSFSKAREGVPFPAALEVLLMELSFELIREAGVRLPGTMGNTIGIVGGLIIGQAAVEANLVSPIVVIVVAFTALCSFAIPNEEFAFSFRILKFLLIALSSWFGFFGFLIGLFFVLVHMASLKSFDVPYLAPYVGAQLNGYQDEKDSVVRFPLRMLWKRPMYAKESERVKLRKKNDKEHR
jgi:spore germination protein